MSAISPATLEMARVQLCERGYAVIENVLDAKKVGHYRSLLDQCFERERRASFAPEDAPALPEDAEMEHFLRQSYAVSEAELERLMRRMRHTRALYQDTPWPVPPHEVTKNFLHLPTLFD